MVEDLLDSSASNQQFKNGIEKFVRGTQVGIEDQFDIVVERRRISFNMLDLHNIGYSSK